MRIRILMVRTNSAELEENGKNGCAKLICFVHTPIFPLFCAFWGRKIQISKCFRLIPFPISQLSPLNEKSRSTDIYMFTLAANLPYFQIPDLEFLKDKRKIINKHIPPAHPVSECPIYLDKVWQSLWLRIYYDRQRKSTEVSHLRCFICIKLENESICNKTD